MYTNLSSLLTLYAFSTGRRLFALTQVKKRAKDLAFPQLEAHAALAIKHDNKTRELDHQWSAPDASAPKGPNGKTGLQSLDGLVDRTLTALRDGAAVQAFAAEPNDGTEGKVDTFLHTIFPAGVQAITSLPYVDELAAVDTIVAKLEGPLAPLVKELALTRIAKRLAKLAKEYRAAQEQQPLPGLSFETVSAARAEGQEHLLQVVAMIVGRYPLSTPEHLAARTTLLGPILHQNEAIRLYQRSRRTVEDVDPETGEVEPSAPAAGGKEVTDAEQAPVAATP